MGQKNLDMKPGQMSIDSPGVYVLEQNRLFLAGFKLKCAWRRRFCSGDSYPPETSII